MKALLLGFTLLTSSLSFGQQALSKAEIQQSLDQMRKTGMFTEEQLKLAEQRLMSMSEKDMQELNEKGMKMAQDPEMQEKVKKVVDQMKQKQSAN